MMIALIFVFEFVFLWTYRIRHLFGGDSAEYLTVGNTWSIAHPPGYPLYSFVLNLVRMFQIDSSMVLLSIVPTVITSCILYRIFLLFKKNRVLAVIPAVLYVFLFPIWLYALVPETFALNSAFIAVITYVLLKQYLHKEHASHLWIFFVFGFGLAHHQTILLYLPGWFFLFQKQLSTVLKKKSLIFKSLFAFLIGLTPYMYAPVASFFTPVLDFENAKTLNGFFRLVTRYTYGSFRSYMGSRPDLLTQLLGVFSSFVYILLDFRIIGIVFIVLGLLFLHKKYKTIFRFAIAIIIVELLFFFYINFTLRIAFGAATFERFLISYYFILAFLFGLGFIFFAELMQKFRLLSAFYTFGIILTGIIFFSNFKTIQYVRSISEFDTYAKDVLDNLPKNSILATTSDNSTFTVDYYYFVKKFRPDIKVLSVGIFNRSYYQTIMKKRYPDLNYRSISTGDLSLFLKDNSSGNEIFFETPSAAGYWIPYGLVWKYYPDKKAADAEAESILSNVNHIWQNLHIPNLNSDQKNIYHLKALQDDYLGKLYAYSRYLFSLKKDTASEEYLKMVLRYDKTNHSALGLLLWIQSRNKDCMSAKKTLHTFTKELNTSSLDELGTAMSYYYYCDAYNKEASKLLDQYRTINTTSSSQPTQNQLTK